LCPQFFTVKSTNNILTYILLVAVAGLYVLHFSGASNDANSEDVQSTDSVVVSEPELKSGPIYYVNTDTVWAEYDYVKEILSMMEKKQSSYESQLENRLRGFEQEVAEFQQKGPLMSEMEVRIKQQDLIQKEQELGQLRQELELKMMQEEEEWNKKLRNKIVTYIDDYTSDRSYDYILGYAQTSNIILANDSLDLTEDIVNGLNAQYEEENKKE
jgi:outer membrane protein